MSHEDASAREPQEHVQRSASRYRIRKGREELLACETGDHHGGVSPIDRRCRVFHARTDYEVILQAPGGYVMRVLCNDARCRFLSSLGVGGTQEIQGYFRFDQFRRCDFVFRHSVLVKSFRSGFQRYDFVCELGTS